MTTEQIKAWLTEKRDECIAVAPYGPVSFTAKCDNFGGVNEPRITFAAYCESIGHAAESSDPVEAVDNFRRFVGCYSKSEKAEQLRQQAAELIAYAEKLEAQN